MQQEAPLTLLRKMLWKQPLCTKGLILIRSWKAGGLGGALEKLPTPVLLSLEL